MLVLRLITYLLGLHVAYLAAATATISDIVVRGNARVEAEAILATLASRKGEPIDPLKVRQDLRNLYELGYFSHIRILKEEKEAEVILIVEVREKPAIVEIVFTGTDEIAEDTLREQLVTKLHTIVNEGDIADDVLMIEKKYAEKGYYLARVDYTLRREGENEMVLAFNVTENNEVQIGAVNILGNTYFTGTDLISKLALRPKSRMPNFRAHSSFQEELLKRDVGFLLAFYKDQGFAEAKIAQPLLMLSKDKRFVDITYRIEEGSQYYVADLDVSGDLVFSHDELQNMMALKPGGLFRFSHFRQDIEMLVDKYGDLGYAYADVNPQTRLDREKRTVHIDYSMTKGEKVYVGKIQIVGNTKTRDNVIRREFEIHDSELYSGTKLARSKENIERLGFFDTVQIAKERAKEEENLLNLKVKIKERATGQLQAAVIFTPGGGSARSGWAGQGRYDEKNQSGRGWRTNFTGKWDGKKNFSLNLGFSNPRVWDSLWSLSTSAFYTQESRRYTSNEFIEETRKGGTIGVGRKLFEYIRASLTYKLQKTKLFTDTFVLQKFREEGVSSSVTLALSRNATNDFLEPSAGSEVTLYQVFTGGGVLQGDKKFMETSIDAAYYYPIEFLDNYRTYIRLRGLLSYIYPMGNEPVPFIDRYRLGGFNDLRGFPYWEIGPKFYVLKAPGDTPVEFNKGGNKKLLFQIEYYIPLIQEAKIKAMLFTDIGRVYDDHEMLSLRDLRADVGFGIRWITPIAPLRFEWAYPIENGKLGDMEFIFYLGY